MPRLWRCLNERCSVYVFGGGTGGVCRSCGSYGLPVKVRAPWRRRNGRPRDPPDRPSSS